MIRRSVCTKIAWEGYRVAVSTGLTVHKKFERQLLIRDHIWEGKSTAFSRIGNGLFSLLFCFGITQRGSFTMKPFVFNSKAAVDR